MLGHLTYLALELAWALPVVAGQWILGRRALRSRWRSLILAVAISTLYLSCADALAIKVGIWSLNPDLTVGFWIGGLPIEEAVFFLLADIMVVQGILMLGRPTRIIPEPALRPAVRPPPDPSTVPARGADRSAP
jgi:lycopene cyclase domain-containing protein